VLGAFELDGDETCDGALIVREGQPVRRVVERLDLEDEDPERFGVLVGERVCFC